LSDWLPAFIRRSRAPSLADFAASLKRELEGVIPRAFLGSQPSGFHICGFDEQVRPDFWFLSNIGAMRGFEYTDLRGVYLDPASHFLGRDADRFGFDLTTGRAPIGSVQLYRNGDFRVHAIAAEALDRVLSTLGHFADFKLPRTPTEYGSYVKFKFEVISYIYKRWARRQIVAHPIDVLVLQAPHIGT